MKHLTVSALTFSLLLTAGGALPGFTAARPAAAMKAVKRAEDKPFHFSFDYDKADKNLFNDEVKRQIEGAAHFLEGFINTKGEITVTVVSGNTGNAFASAAPKYETNTPDEAKITEAGITFRASDLQKAADGKADIQALTVHELMHCLGVTSQSKILAKNLKRATGMYSSPNLLRVNSDQTVSFDGSHFPYRVKDINGVRPRISDGGGSTLSILDLVLLADLGYDVPQIAAGGTVATLRYPESYYETVEYTDGKTYRGVYGEAGNDTLVAYDYERNGGPGGYILSGGGGDDVLISGPGNDILDGENAVHGPANGKPGHNTFVIGADKGKDKIMGYRPGMDTIYISPATGVTTEKLEAAIKELEAAKKGAKQESAGRGYYPGNWVLKVDDFELIVSTGNENIKPSLSDFKVEDWKEQ